MYKDNYEKIAEYYDYMLNNNPKREMFFETIFKKYNVKSILDCSCGTGKDLLLFNKLGYNVTGSDISDSMLKIAKDNIKSHKDEIDIKKADFHALEEVFTEKFDAVVCLSNSINEETVNPIQALCSMKKVLNEDGIIIFDQGQTDFTMKNPSKYSLEVNNRDFSRLYTMDYEKNIMTVNIYDFLHTEHKTDFRLNAFRLKIRLFDDWEKILNESNLKAEYYGNWGLYKYDKDISRRLIVIATECQQNTIMV